MEERLASNKLLLQGEAVSGFNYSHEAYGEKFYQIEVLIERTSGYGDVIPVVVSERLTDVSQDIEGSYIEVVGTYRSYNRHDDSGKSRLILFAFAKEFGIVSENENENKVRLDGYLCKPPVYRKTPLGRDIADLLIAVNRPYRKSDYIPCICWGRNAEYMGKLEVGTHIILNGRVQSRNYEKEVSNHEYEDRIAYEVSVSSLEISKENGGECK